MIVLVKMKSGENKKAFVRNDIFHEANNLNKKTTNLTTSTIDSVYWPDKEGIKNIPVKEWLTMADENNYWNLTA